MSAPTALAIAALFAATTVSAPSPAPAPASATVDGGMAAKGGDRAPEIEGPRLETPAVFDQLGINPIDFDQRRRSAVGILVAAGALNILSFGLRGAHYWLISDRCAPIPGDEDGALPGDTQCPKRIYMQLLAGSHRTPNIGLFFLTVSGARNLGRLRAERVKYGVARPFNAARRMEITTPIAYFSAISVLSLGFLVFYDNATTPTGTKLLERPTNQPAFNPLLQFGVQTMMTATAVSLAYYMHAKAYSDRADDLELIPIGSVIPGGATFGLGGRF